MTPEDRAHLLSMAYVALTQVPQHVRADFAKKPSAYREPATRLIAETLIEYIERAFTIEKKELPKAFGYGPSSYGAGRREEG
jgi:hypothetical protein